MTLNSKAYIKRTTQCAEPTLDLQQPIANKVAKKLRAKAINTDLDKNLGDSFRTLGPNELDSLADVACHLLAGRTIQLVLCLKDLTRSHRHGGSSVQH